MYISQQPIPQEWSVEMIRYLKEHVNDDGEWALRLEGPSTVLATGLYYILLRILGLVADHSLTRRARSCLLAFGGAIGVPQWGKIWLSCLNLYSWQGLHPIPPDLWLLPDWVPFHPWRWWVQCRVAYLPTSYLYSKRFDIPLNPLLLAIREVYTQRFSEIDFRRYRSTVAAADIKKPHSLLLKVINFALQLWEMVQPLWLLKCAQRQVCELIRGEDENTNYNDLAPVSKAFQMVSVWDTAFSIQAAVDAGLATDPEFQPSWCCRATREHGPFAASGHSVPELITRQRRRDCIDTLLVLQNKDGGFASYENILGSALLEYISPAEIFDRIMVEYSYIECTTAVLTSLSMYPKLDSTYRSADIEAAICRATAFIEASQSPDGSWYGSWAICFTYVTFFALVSLSTVGQTFANNRRVRRACAFLLSKQRADGGWGEHYMSCEVQTYVQLDSQVVNTAWATLALMHAEFPNKVVIEKGLNLVRSRQRSNREWKQEGIGGVFNRTCMIEYPNYKHYFTVWALGRFQQSYLPRWKELQYQRIQ